MSHIILTGTTSLVGSAVLHKALSHPLINKITILARRPLLDLPNSPKITVIIHQNSMHYPPELLTRLAGAEACIWAQGNSENGVSEGEYVITTVEYPLAAARVLTSLGGERKGTFNFVYVSGEGANMAEKSVFMWCRIKGRAERMLLELMQSSASWRVFVVRPAIIFPDPKLENGFGRERKTSAREGVQVRIAGMLAIVGWKNVVTPVGDLARVLVELAIGDGEAVEDGIEVETKGRVLRNEAIRRLAGI